MRGRGLAAPSYSIACMPSFCKAAWLMLFPFCCKLRYHLLTPLDVEPLVLDPELDDRQGGGMRGCFFCGRLPAPHPGRRLQVGGEPLFMLFFMSANWVIICEGAISQELYTFSRNSSRMVSNPAGSIVQRIRASRPASVISYSLRAGRWVFCSIPRSLTSPSSL
ncbi:hypothetical protein [Brevibacillus composti]|nr:hypothetical protein [Brevibacillus composti]